MVLLPLSTRRMSPGAATSQECRYAGYQHSLGRLHVGGHGQVAEGDPAPVQDPRNTMPRLRGLLLRRLLWVLHGLPDGTTDGRLQPTSGVVLFRYRPTRRAAHGNGLDSVNDEVERYGGARLRKGLRIICVAVGGDCHFYTCARIVLLVCCVLGRAI
jgi:hypothetical protein